MNNKRQTFNIDGSITMEWNQYPPCVLCKKTIGVDERPIQAEFAGMNICFCEFCWKQGEECGGIEKLIETMNKIKRGVDRPQTTLGQELRKRRQFF
jgi:hypothetical protein